MTDSAINLGSLNGESISKTNARPRGDKRANDVIEARQRRLYKHQLEGLTPRQLVYEHASRESVAVTTAWRDWRVVQAWNEEDWARDREKMLSRLQQMRSKLFHQALKKGQLQTAAQVLDSLGRVLGEAAPEQIAISAPQLSIKIEDKGPLKD